ncbi:thioredoxin family protein [Ralstonia insidiosa]|jgi:thioredoxin-related protein|uniref:DUF255 domain-containing protein n=1 Tax=Ralstonia insidiosa TaxID=190721 RepID=A0A191ZY70_9RALS|nr:thioredoxin fold domain-containing protein [Ralstonia insidiosa]ANJ73028.1 hypothetical protein A9Y76_11360 [Ralstonia insidiosa]KAB0473480.1 DUF255 domain-containing protein [Ralstonia insidiosa]MBY4911435.1 thioredoxin family protein [Ralstonia insidiosa]NMV38401.1 DUF255 domain-containing protein [Ralstonia insidiosa]
MPNTSTLRTLLLALLLVLMSSMANAAPPKEWGFLPLGEAIKIAKRDNKPIFVLFGFEDCPWCSRLYAGAMSDNDLRAQYQSSVVLAYFDTKGGPKSEVFDLPNGVQQTRAGIIQIFAAYPTPSWVFLSPDGTTLGAGRNGKTTAREMRRDLETALAKKSGS